MVFFQIKLSEMLSLLYFAVRERWEKLVVEGLGGLFLRGKKVISRV
jgi:hypothetical protein